MLVAMCLKCNRVHDIYRDFLTWEAHNGIMIDLLNAPCQHGGEGAGEPNSDTEDCICEECFEVAARRFSIPDTGVEGTFAESVLNLVESFFTFVGGRFRKTAFQSFQEKCASIKAPLLAIGQPVVLFSPGGPDEEDCFILLVVKEETGELLIDTEADCDTINLLDDDCVNPSSFTPEGQWRLRSTGACHAEA